MTDCDSNNSYCVLVIALKLNEVFILLLQNYRYLVFIAHLKHKAVSGQIKPEILST